MRIENNTIKCGDEEGNVSCDKQWKSTIRFKEDETAEQVLREIFRHYLTNLDLRSFFLLDQSSTEEDIILRPRILPRI